jgi:tRNA(Ile)-lysidine synthase
MADIVARVRESIQRYRLVSTRDTVLAAVSGGPDSVCMLHVLLDLREEFGFGVKVAHLDHQFRGEASREDAAFVRDLATDFGVPCICEEVNVPQYLLSRRMSPQEAARHLRYQFLVKTSKLEYCQRIATGHNADDQVETVLMRVLRGAGPTGLAGIPPKREGVIVRPMLGVWRTEIDDYITEHGLPTRTDASNADPKYLRNRIRHHLLPDLRTYNPGIDRALLNLGAIMTDVAAHLEQATDRALPKVVEQARLGQFTLDLTKLTDYDEASQSSILRRAFESLRPDLAPLAFQHVEALMVLVRRADVGSAVELPDGARARLEHGRLVLSHGEGPPEIPVLELPIPGSATFEEAELAITAELLPREKLQTAPEEAGEDVAFFDWDAVRPPLLVRPRKEGDRLLPFGMDGTKTLKALFIDSKIPFSLRSAVPLLCDRNAILWVVGMRRSAEAVVTEATKNVLVVRARSLEDTSGIRKSSPY